MLEYNLIYKSLARDFVHKTSNRMADKMALFDEEKTPDEDNSMNDNNAENDGKIFAIL